MTDLNAFVKDAIHTESKIDTVRTNPSILRDVIKTAISVGNLLDMLKKNIFYDKPIDKRAFETYVNEIGYLNANLKNMDSVLLETRKDININPRIFHSAIGIATEATEILETLKFYGEDIDTVNFLEELGDISWYEAIGIDELNGNFEDILIKVISKLKARYPNKFNSNNAINRDLNAERAILEADILPVTKVE